MALKTNYIDSIYTQKQYKQTSDGQGNITLEDVTVYSQVGDSYGCEDLNKQNREYNRIENGLSNIDDFITALNTALNPYGESVSANSPNAIMNALNSLAAHKRSEGEATGINKVRNNPTSYGVYDPRPLYITENSYRTQISNAIAALTGTFTPIPSPSPVYISFEHDPIHSGEASRARNALNGVLSTVKNGWTTAEGQGETQFNGAINALA